jgi:hypothetical protein
MSAARGRLTISRRADGEEEAATLDGELDVLETGAGCAADAQAPDEEAGPGFGQRRRCDGVAPAELSTDVGAVNWIRSVGKFIDHPEQVEQIVVGHRVTVMVDGHELGRLDACFAFFWLRFSFSVLPDFFDWCWRGDLSAISCSLR